LEAQLGARTSRAPFLLADVLGAPSPLVMIKVSRPRARPACDFCRSTLARGERHRLVWDSAVHGELVLAELCAGCATRWFGSRRSQLDSLRLVQDGRASALAGRASVLAPKAVGFTARGVLYLLIAVTFFLIVTVISSYAH